MRGGEAGRSSGELVFPIVFTPEMHFHEFSSAVADMKNSVAVSKNNRNLFLKNRKLEFTVIYTYNI